MTATLLPRKNVRFLLGPIPVLVLAGAPIHGELPIFRAGAGLSDGMAAACAGWRILPRLTLCLVDGPGDAGCLIPGLLEAADLGALQAWCEAAESAGGAIVVSLDALPGRLDWDEIEASGTARGGFVACFDRSPLAEA